MQHTIYTRHCKSYYSSHYSHERYSYGQDSHSYKCGIQYKREAHNHAEAVGTSGVLV